MPGFDPGLFRQQAGPQIPAQAGTPTPSPSSSGGGFDNTPISGNEGSSLTNPSAGVAAAAPQLNPPPEFVSMASSIIKARMGNPLYVDNNRLADLIQKIWQSPAVQYNWSQYQNDPQTWGAAVAQQVSNEVLNPADDPTITVDYTNLKLGSGRGLSLTEQQALANVTQAQGAMVPAPFNARTISGYDYGTPMPKGGWTGTGQSFGWATHMGVDYGTQVGDRIVAPFAGTLEVKTGVEGYGNQVLLHLDNGWTIGFGHIAQGMGNGTRVNPGDLIAIAGQNVGSAKGSVTLVTWQDPQGRFQNPHEILDPIFKGTNFQQLGVPPALAGTGMPSVNQALDTKYPSIHSDWVQYFGSPPSPQDVYNVIQHGTNPAQWTDYIRSLPSHIPGLATGNAYDLRQIADTISTRAYGHLATDGIVQELAHQGLTKPNDVQYFYDMMPGKDLDRKTYNDVFSANTAITYNIFNEKGADPRIIAEQALRQKQLAAPPGVVHGGPQEP